MHRPMHSRPLSETSDPLLSIARSLNPQNVSTMSMDKRSVRSRASPVLARVFGVLAAGLVLAGCDVGSGSSYEPRDLPDASGSSVCPGRPGPTAPSRHFDLSHWKLTLPSGDEIQAAELDGYQHEGEFFMNASDAAMVFCTPNLAGTTPNSEYSRSELREMRIPTGSASAPDNNWTTALGGTMNARLRVDAVSTTGEDRKQGRVIIGQIHSERTEVVRLYFHKRPDEARGRVYVGTDDPDTGQNTFSTDIVSNQGTDGIALGEAFEYQIDLHGLDLEVIVTRDGRPAARFVQRIGAGYNGQRLYFKAGAYNQNNSGAASDYTQVSFFALDVRH